MYQPNHVLCPRNLQEKCAFRYALRQNYNRIGFDFRLLPVFPILEIKVADSTETHGRGTCQAGRRQGHPCNCDKRKSNEYSSRRSGINGKLIVIGAANEPLEVPLLPLLSGRQ
jgi:hypothetical protein